MIAPPNFEIKGLKYYKKEVGKNIPSTKVYHRWDFIFNGFPHILEFWDSKLSGKKKVALDSRIIYFREINDNALFHLDFTIGYNAFHISQYGEDHYDLLIDGNRFSNLMSQERYEKKFLIQKKEREKQKVKKMQEDYYQRALKYNGKDYYEGKEKILLNNNNNINNNNINNNNINNNKYNYEYYKKHRNDYLKNNNYNYGNDNNYNNNMNNNYNNNYYQQNNNQIINQNDINQIKQNINKNNQINNNKYDPYFEEEPKDNQQIDNPYPSFSVYQNTENNAGNNNRPFLNKDDNVFKDNTRDNNNNYMNQLEDVFASQNNENKKSKVKNELPNYSELINNQNKNQLNKQNSKDSNLFNYIGNLNNNNNNIKQSSKESVPNVNKQGEYNFGFEDDVHNSYNIDDNNQIQLNIYNHKKVDEERNKKKVYVNKSSFKIPLQKEDYEMDNPYNDD